MPQPLIAPMPPDLDLAGGYTVRVTALNPATGATVSGVTVSNVVIAAENISSALLTSGDFAPLPLLVPSEG